MCRYTKLRWNQLNFFSRFTIVLFWWLIPLGPVAGLLYLAFALVYATMVVGIPIFPRCASAAFYAIHPFGRRVVSDHEYRPRNWVYVAWILSIVLFSVWLLTYWFLCLPVILLMAIFYWPYFSMSIDILKIFANPLGFRAIYEDEEYALARKAQAAAPIVVTPYPVMLPQSSLSLQSSYPQVTHGVPMFFAQPDPSAVNGKQNAFV